MVGEEDAAQIQLPSISAKKPALVAERRSTKGSLTLFRGKISCSLLYRDQESGQRGQSVVRIASYM